jgi:hypothetical protein
MIVAGNQDARPVIGLLAKIRQFKGIVVVGCRRKHAAINRQIGV